MTACTEYMIACMNNVNVMLGTTVTFNYRKQHSCIQCHMHDIVFMVVLYIVIQHSERLHNTISTSHVLNKLNMLSCIMVLHIHTLYILRYYIQYYHEYNIIS